MAKKPNIKLPKANTIFTADNGDDGPWLGDVCARFDYVVKDNEDRNIYEYRLVAVHEVGERVRKEIQ